MTPAFAEGCSPWELRPPAIESCGLEVLDWLEVICPCGMVLADVVAECSTWLPEFLVASDAGLSVSDCSVCTCEMLGCVDKLVYACDIEVGTESDLPTVCTPCPALLLEFC